ncbi:D-alanyl-D-alanine carboxypeptidase [Deinococcus sp. RL]|uniref:D-alanyl-D-alanine carboxypeptidase/D-alanyl-D-alanine-endopeptidase n=1 Tax=Deinococcus sp. RL TaxID=1489678 RepID=UPI0004DB07CD|nr:D-alanyl-D-alanine carboxypeptidase [Deinococcus sp. RL]KEF33893.1 D-alanyl-D-alanine carboxypeptidase [Deinococcus sp. RL]
MRRALALLLLLPSLGALSRAGAPSAPAPTPPAIHVTLTRPPGLSAEVRRALAGLPPGVRLGLLVRDLETGEVLEAREEGLSLIPASTVKLVTAAAVLADRGDAGWWSTELTVPASEAGRARVTHLTLRGGGDPTLRVADGPGSLRVLARQAYARGLREVGAVRLDETRLDAAAWQDPLLGVPMTALRLADWHAAPPTSAAQARGWAGAALIRELRRAGVRVRSDEVGTAPRYLPPVPPPRRDERGRPLPPDPFLPPAQRPEQGVASVRSGPPFRVLAEVLRPSDNLGAEELLATLAPPHGTREGALGRGWAALRRLGVDTAGVHLADGSGLSRENRLTARALVDLLDRMYDLPYVRGEPRAELPGQTYRARRNAFAEALPQAGVGGEVTGRGGTLAGRLRGLDVRAKTGTLPGVSALAGYVTARSGRGLGFALLMNGPRDTPILTLRAVQDDVVRAVAERY